MGVNVDISLRPEIWDAHPNSDIRSVIWNIGVLDELADEEGMTSLSELGLAEEDDDEEEDSNPHYFKAAEGVATIECLINRLRSTPKEAKERARHKKRLASLQDGPEALIEELEELLRSLKVAEKRKAKFRLFIAQ